MGLDRVRADQAGQQVTPVPGLATSTAAGIARRFTAAHWRGTEAGLAAATARMTAPLPAERTAELAEGPVTIDIDATDVEVYGSKKRGVAYTYQGQRAGCARGLVGGDRDPAGCGPAGRRPTPAHRWSRCWGGRWPRCRGRSGRAAAAGRKIALRADAGYFAGELARAAACREHGLRDRRQADRQHVEGAGRDRGQRLAGRDRHAERAGRGLDVQAADWPEDTVLLVRRVKLDPDQVSADPRSRRRRTLHPDQRAPPIRNWNNNRPSTPTASSAPTWTCPPRPGPPRWSMVQAPHQHREHLPRQQARRRAAPPALRP